MSELEQGMVNKLSVLHLQTSLNLACGITRMLYQITRFKQPDCQQVIFYLDGNAVHKFSDAGVRIIPLGGNKSGSSVVRHVISIVRYCKDHNITVINAHHRYFDVVGKIVSVITGIPLVTCVQSKVYSRRRFSYFADQFIAPGENIKQHMQKHFSIPAKAITVINNFVVPEDYRVAPQESITALRHEHNIPGESCVVLFMGRFSREKGIDVLMNAMARALEENKQLWFVLVGDGEERKLIEAALKRFPRQYTLLPSVSDVSPWYQLADIITLPSRVDPYPLAVLETGYFSKPLIGGAVDGIAEVIHHNENGYLVAPEDETALYEAIQLLSSDSALRNRLGNMLRNTIMANNISYTKLPEYFSVYRSLLS